MSVISHQNGAISGLVSCAPALSFYEMRVAEAQLINPVFAKLGSGWWGYYMGPVQFAILKPSWDPGYDWEVAYAKAARRLGIRWGSCMESE